MTMFIKWEVIKYFYDSSIMWVSRLHAMFWSLHKRGREKPGELCISQEDCFVDVLLESRVLLAGIREQDHTYRQLICLSLCY